jgi:glutamate 5-kinase
MPALSHPVSVDTPGSSFGTGGMATKLIAAELATAAGVATVIINGAHPAAMLSVVERGLPPLGDAAVDSLASSISSLGADELAQVGAPALEDPPHTLFLPISDPLARRKWSLLHALHPAGSLFIDEGAYRRLSRPDSGGRLLPAGVVGVEGTWERMQAVRIVLRRPASDSAAGASHAGTADDELPPPATLAQRGLSVFLRNEAGSGTSTPIHLAGDEPVHLVPAAAVLEGEARDREEETTRWEWIEVGRGLANYNSIESERIKGIKSSQISAT